ncbi:MAG: hypothetical protein M5T61_04375 [Acidimicrobiia bacterium]|nr:hypothetical protein [Acidimicrobiia bacterium]
MTSRATRLAAVFVSGALLFALPACGGDDDDGDKAAQTTTTVSGDEGTTTTTETTTTDAPAETTGAPADTTVAPPTSVAPADPADLALARSAALDVGDLPAGWTLDDESENTGTFGSVDDEEFRDACPAVYEEVTSIVADGGEPVDVSHSFSREGGMPSLDSTPSVFGSDDLAARAFAVINGDAFYDCIATDLAASVDPGGGTEMGDPDLERIPVEGPGLDDAGGFSLMVPVTSQGTVMTMRYSIVALRSGRLLHMIVMLSVEETAPFPEMGDVIDAAVARTAAA